MTEIQMLASRSFQTGTNNGEEGKKMSTRDNSKTVHMASDVSEYW